MQRERVKSRFVIPALFVCAVIGARYLARRDDECSQHVQGEGTVTRRLCLLNKRLREAGVEEAMVYGHKDGALRHAVPAEQLTYYTTNLVALLDKQPSEVSRVCEIGFAGGHSALAFLTAYPNASYLAFDQWDRAWYQDLGLRFVRNLFPGRVTVVFGDSTVSVPRFLNENPGVECDIISVDGAHHSHFPLHDLYNMLPYARERHVLLADDCTHSWPAVEDAWRVLQRLGAIVEHEKVLTEYTHRGSVKGWCAGSYTAAQVQSTRACQSGCANTLSRLFHDHTGFQQYWPEATKQRSSTRGCLRDIAALPKCDTSARSCDFSTLMDTQAPTAFTGALERLEKAAGADAFTIVLLVYRRLGNLVRSLHHYAGSSASELLLVWNNMDDAPSEELEQFLAAHRRLHESLPIRIVRVEANSLNNRYFVHEHVHTTGVLFVDDDVLYDLRQLHDAFFAWRAAQHRLLGFFARSYQAGSEGQYTYVCGVTGAGTAGLSHSSYSMVIGKGVFVHKRYLVEYSRPEYEPLHRIVDETHSDDLALNFVVANLSNTPPLHHPVEYVELPPLPTYQALSANWNVGGVNKRDAAVTKLVQFFGRMPLVPNTQASFVARNEDGSHLCIAAEAARVTC